MHNQDQETHRMLNDEAEIMQKMLFMEQTHYLLEIIDTFQKCSQLWQALILMLTDSRRLFKRPLKLFMILWNLSVKATPKIKQKLSEEWVVIELAHLIQFWPSRVFIVVEFENILKAIFPRFECQVDFGVVPLVLYLMLFCCVLIKIPGFILIFHLILIIFWFQIKNVFFSVWFHVFFSFFFFGGGVGGSILSPFILLNVILDVWKKSVFIPSPYLCSGSIDTQTLWGSPWRPCWHGDGPWIRTRLASPPTGTASSDGPPRPTL